MTAQHLPWEVRADALGEPAGESLWMSQWNLENNLKRIQKDAWNYN